MQKMTLMFNPKRLKAERIAADLTQEELSKKLGKSRVWYAKREAGIIDTGSDELALIANVLNISDVSIFFKRIVPEKQLNIHQPS